MKGIFKNSRLTAGLWFLGATIALGLFLGVRPSKYVELDPLFKAEPTQKPLGKILETKGSSLAKSKAQRFFHPASAGQKLFSLHRILTGFDSEVLVDLGEAFWLLPNSQVKLNHTGKDLEVHLLAGSLKRVPKASTKNMNKNIKKSSKKESRTKFFVAGVPTSDKEIRRGHLASLTKLPFDELKMETVAEPKKAEKIAGINELQIHKNFRLHQKFIEKCFIAYYSSVSGKTKSGKVWLRFKIKKAGKVDSPAVSRSDYKDEKFHNCLENVVSRVKIKGYKGPVAQVEFPIDIQLPQESPTFKELPKKIE